MLQQCTQRSKIDIQILRRKAEYLADLCHLLLEAPQSRAHSLDLLVR